MEGWICVLELYNCRTVGQFFKYINVSLYFRTGIRMYIHS